MNKTFLFIGFIALVAITGMSARWYGGWGGGWYGRPGVSIGFGVGSPYYGGYWGGYPYGGYGWGGYGRTYVYSNPRPSRLEVINNSNEQVTVNGRSLQPDKILHMPYARDIYIQGNSGSVELTRPSDRVIEVFKGTDGAIDASN